LAVSGRGSRRVLALGGLFTVFGLAIAATAPIARADGADGTRALQVCGGTVVLVGWGLLAWGIHRFGRESS
jgi:hypothetical protein